MPLTQIGMNVKMQIDSPVSQLFKKLDLRKHENFRGGFEPIPDVALFSPSVSADWRRRNFAATLRSMLLAVEIKASERADSRLGPKEVTNDIEKLAAHRDEAIHRETDFYPAMMVIDTAPLLKERMTDYGFDLAFRRAEELGVGFLYLSPNTELESVNKHLAGAGRERFAPSAS